MNWSEIFNFLNNFNLGLRNRFRDLFLRAGGCGFRNGVETKDTVFLVSSQFGDKFLFVKIVFLVHSDSFVLNPQSLSFEIWSQEHPSKYEDHAQHHYFCLFGLVLFSLVSGNQEENDDHVTMGEEHIDPVLTAFKGILLNFDVEVLFYQKIFELPFELIGRQDVKTFNLGPIDIDFWFGGGFFLSRFLFFDEGDLLEEGYTDGNKDEDVDGCADDCCWIILIHDRYIKWVDELVDCKKYIFIK